MKIDLEEMRQYERDNFAVEVKPDRWDTGGTTLSVTHNGRQWISVSLLDANEIQAVINVLQERLGSLTPRAADDGCSR